MNLNNIETAKVGDVLWDKGDRNSVKGLHLRIRSETCKVFSVYYRTKSGRQRRPKIGTLGEIPIAEARRRAKAILARVAVGEDPKGDWDNVKVELTVDELFEKVYAAHWNTPRFIASKWAYNVRGFYTQNIKPVFGSHFLSEMTPTRIRTWHAKYRDNHAFAGNRSLETLSKIFSYAEEQEWRAQGTNPCKLVKAHPERKRDRYASSDEIKKVAFELEQEAAINPARVAYMYLLIFSGSRPAAILKATWDQLETFKDENGIVCGKLTFHGKSTDKTGRLEQVILPPQAMAVIDKLPRHTKTITGLKAFPRAFWQRVRKRAGATGLWARDWRRTFATIGFSDGIGRDQVGQLLNHHSAQTTMTYAKLNHDARVVAANQIANKLEELMKQD